MLIAYKMFKWIIIFENIDKKNDIYYIQDDKGFFRCLEDTINKSIEWLMTSKQYVGKKDEKIIYLRYILELDDIDEIIGHLLGGNKRSLFEEPWLEVIRVDKYYN